MEDKNSIFSQCYKDPKNSNSLCSKKKTLSSRILNLSKIFLNKTKQKFNRKNES